MESKAIKLYKGNPYHVSEKMVTEYESGIIHFEDHEGNRLTPSYFGRSGDGFNATFKIIPEFDLHPGMMAAAGPHFKA